MLFPEVRQMQIHHHQAQQADGNIQKKDHPPVRVPHNQSARHRPQHRRHQCRNRYKAHHPQQVRLGETPHQRQPSHRHHHRPAHSLHHAASHQQMNVAAQSAQQRTQREQPNRRSKHPPRSKPVRHPSADRDKHRQRQRIAGQHRLHRQRPNVQRLSHRRHSGIQNRSIQRLHEEGHSHQPGQQAQAGRRRRRLFCQRDGRSRRTHFRGRELISANS